MDWRGLFRRDGGICRAQLNSGGILHRVLTSFNFKCCVARFDEPNVGTWLGFPGPMSWGPPAADAAGTKECEGHHQQDGSDDDGRVVYGEKGPEGKCSH